VRHFWPALPATVGRAEGRSGRPETPSLVGMIVSTAGMHVKQKLLVAALHVRRSKPALQLVGTIRTCP
jgi:hypothetical protein